MIILQWIFTGNFKENWRIYDWKGGKSIGTPKDAIGVILAFFTNCQKKIFRVYSQNISNKNSSSVWEIKRKRSLAKIRLALFSVDQGSVKENPFFTKIPNKYSKGI